MKRYPKDSDEHYLLKKFNWMIFKNTDKLSTDESDKFDPNVEKKYNKKLKKYLNLYDIKTMLANIDETLSEAWYIKDEFQDMYQNSTIDTIENDLDKMIQLFKDSHIGQFQEFANTLRGWRTEIINSFTVMGYKYLINSSDGVVSAQQIKMNNALIERKNGIIKCLKKNACGYSNWTRFRNRVLYVLDKSANFSLSPFDKEDN